MWCPAFHRKHLKGAQQRIASPLHAATSPCRVGDLLRPHLRQPCGCCSGHERARESQRCKAPTSRRGEAPWHQPLLARPCGVNSKIIAVQLESTWKGTVLRILGLSGPLGRPCRATSHRPAPSWTGPKRQHAAIPIPAYSLNCLLRAKAAAALGCSSANRCLGGHLVADLFSLCQQAS